MPNIDGDTYMERAAQGQLGTRADTSAIYGTVIISTATPIVPPGSLWYHPGTSKLFLQIGTVKASNLRTLI